MDLQRQRNVFVRICGGYPEVETALAALQAHGCGLKSVSVIGQDLSAGREVMGCYQIGRGCRYWGPLAAFWEGLWDMLCGGGVFWIPDCGGLLIAGAFVSNVIASLENSSIFSGLTAIGSALYSLGIPLDDVVRYEASLNERRLLLIVQGAADTVEKARQLLEQFNRQALKSY